MKKMTKIVFTIALVTIATLCALCGCKFVLKDASAAIGEIDCETYKE